MITCKYFLLLFCVVLLSCTETQTIYSPDKQQSLTFVHSTGLSTKPNDIFIYYGSPPVDKSHYIRMAWSNQFGIDVYWNAKPIKIRTITIIAKNTISADLIDARNYSDDSTKGKKDKFSSYDFPDLMAGKYAK